MSIEQAIDWIMKAKDQPPPNEQATRMWVLDPVLESLGYAKTDILPEAPDPMGKVPDYTVLPGTGHCWYLEAKAWNGALTQSQADTTIGYARVHLRRWAVLSNGRVWQLFDCGGEAQSHPLVCSLEANGTDELAGLFRALSKAKVADGGIATYARRYRTHRVLAARMRDPNSDVIGAVVLALRKDSILKSVGVDRSDVVSYFSLPSHTAPIVQPLPATPECCASTDSGTVKSLGSFDPTGRNPTSLICPDGSEHPVQCWRDVAASVIEWVAAMSGLPNLPFVMKGGGPAYTLSGDEHNGQMPMRQPRAICWPGGTAYFEMHAGAANLLSRVRGICEAVGADPAAFAVRLKP